ncbi:MAG TPA: NTP transferase domain-containing protein [Thermoguttaceae bacterium]|nr:NTP transferase domain-containing protein [Thermoguttaceae bacterium]
MLKTLGIVDACYGSRGSRARAARKMGGKSVLEWVVRRATDCQRLNGVIVVTSSAPENDFLSELVPLDVPVFAGCQEDALRCFLAALEDYPAEAAVRICARSPFIDPVLIDRLVSTAEADPECDYVGYRSRDGRPAILSPVGVFAEWFRASALRRAARKARASEDRQQATRYLYRHPERFKIRLIPAPEQIDRDDVRLTVDFEEDWEHALAIFEALGPDDLDWQRIADLLVHQPHLRKRMAALNRVHAKG